MIQRILHLTRNTTQTVTRTPQQISTRSRKTPYSFLLSAAPPTYIQPALAFEEDVEAADFFEFPAETGEGTDSNTFAWAWSRGIGISFTCEPNDMQTMHCTEVHDAARESLLPSNATLHHFKSSIHTTPTSNTLLGPILRCTVSTDASVSNLVAKQLYTPCICRLEQSTAPLRCAGNRTMRLPNSSGFRARGIAQNTLSLSPPAPHMYNQAFNISVEILPRIAVGLDSIGFCEDTTTSWQQNSFPSDEISQQNGNETLLTASHPGISQIEGHTGAVARTLSVCAFLATKLPVNLQPDNLQPSTTTWTFQNHIAVAPLTSVTVQQTQDCVMSETRLVNDCSRPCGGGVAVYERRIVQAGFGANALQCPENNSFKVQCNTDACPAARVSSVGWVAASSNAATAWRR